ncbi:hypothetical protein LCGC14_0797920 [marine sediment metagenome]|uniref:Uncharacterized protein n=1 Tax=marine sediment metagenome TaxID=412755 RepID=A0A0F9SAK3_9ZZZZ
MTRPKLPDNYKKEFRHSFTMLKEHKNFLDKFVNKSDAFRKIMFEIMPKIVATFVKQRIKMDLSEKEIRIIKVYIDEMNK